jgi:exosortase/archaeosortase family protein
MHPSLLAVLVLVATWGGWRWYLERVWASPEEAVALCLTIVLLATFGLVGKARQASPRPIPLAPIALLLTAYAASFLVLPPIARAAIAIAVTLFCFYLALFKERPPVAFWGLVALALPVLPSLQFTLGYPMRVASAELTVALLQANGFLVARQGTFLLWRDEVIQFDAPCSGVNMLWAGLLLTLMGCVLFRLRAGKVMLAAALAVVVILACNLLRASSLFYLESGSIPNAGGWWHEAIGIAAFILSAMVILRLLGQLRDWNTLSWAKG